MVYEVPHYINGKRVIAKSTKELPIYDPAQGKIQGLAYAANQTTINETINNAKASFATWSQTTPLQRSKMLFKLKTLIEENMDKLAQLVTNEHGKTLIEAKGSVQRGLDVLDFACGIPHHLKGSFAENVSREMDSYSLFQPLGVCVGITPFNFPAMIPLWMFPMAVGCGNTFILKPSEKDPSCSIRIAELATEAGFPPGVFNVLQGDREAVDALITHPDVKAVSFVGSTPVAEYVFKTASAHHKRVQAFGGAKNHCIVMPDADLDEAASAIVTSAYGSAGERCMAISVVVTVGDDVAEKLISKMRPLIEKLKVNAGRVEDTDFGPLVTAEHRSRVLDYVAKGKAEGAKLIIDGSQFVPNDYQKGFFMGPCLFDHVSPDMTIYREEIFGPVLSIVRAANIDNALSLINSHEFGNGTAIFTRDGATARFFAEHVEAGMVGINVPVPVPVAYQSFGGWKRSIFADIGMYGTEAIRFYTRLKTVTKRWPKRAYA